MISQNLDLRCDHIGKVNEEQRKRINDHKWIASEKAGRDLGDEAILEWLEKYAPLFRKWAQSLPYACVQCGFCPGVPADELCPTPFTKKRLEVIGKGV